MSVDRREPRGCVFLDRDGTLIADHGYVYRSEDVHILAGVAAGLAALRRAGLWLVVVTNQSGIARGYFSAADVEACHAYLSTQLGPAAAPDAYYYCPCHPDAVDARYRRDSAYRKPGIGMCELARRDFAIDMKRSCMLGDKWLDVEFAHNAGMPAILVGELSKLRDPPPPGLRAARYVQRADFAAAVQTILAWSSDLTQLHMPLQ